MATEYKLSYAASEIDRMLGEIDKPKSWNDLKDKPFYKDSKLLYDYLWEVKGVETTPVEGYDKSRATLTTFPDTNILPHDKIIVDFNGVIYETKFRPAGYGNTIGNGVLGGYGNNDHDNEPFGLSYGMGGMHLNTSEPGIYDVKVYALEETIKPLDVEFLPEGYPKTVRVQSTLVDNMEFTGDYIEYLDISLLKDVQYTVIYDNEEYLCDSYTIPESQNYIFIGNPSNMGGEDNGMPFYMECLEGTKETGVYVTEYAEHTITIKGPVDQPIPMDDKFIPDTVVRHTDVKDVFTMMSKPSPSPQLIHTFENYTYNSIGIAYGNGVYVGVYIKGASKHETSTYLFSVDGINWVEKELPATDEWVNILFGNGVFVLVGYQGTYGTLKNILYSYDGENWERANAEQWHYNLDSAIFVDNEFFIREGYNNHLHSVDGINWEVVKQGIRRYSENHLAYCNGVYVYAESASIIHYTSGRFADVDGWTSVGFPDFSTYYSDSIVCTDGNKFVFMIGSGIAALYSYNGIDWLECKLPDGFSDQDHSITTLVYAKGVFTAIDNSSGDFLYSSDGITWNLASRKDVGLNEEFYYGLETTFRVDDELYCVCSYGNDNGGYRGIMHMNAGTLGGFVPESVAKEKYATKEYAESLSILTSPNGTKFKLSVADDGTLSATPVE